MATVTAGRLGAGRRATPFAADLYEKALGLGAAVLLAAVLAALARGWGEWGRVPGVVWAHLLTIIVALALTPAMMWGRRGDRRHRRIGTLWLVAMFGTALVSLFVRTGGGFSVIHILSLVTLAGVPAIWWTARAHRVRSHRRIVRATVTGALLVAGFFTFPFGRMLGSWLFG